MRGRRGGIGPLWRGTPRAQPLKGILDVQGPENPKLSKEGVDTKVGLRPGR